MTYIQDFKFTRMLNADAAQTHRRLAAAYKTIKIELLTPHIKPYLLACTEFDKEMRQQTDSAETPKMHELDQQRDRMFTELTRDIANTAKFTDPATQDAATRAESILKRYHTDSHAIDAQTVYIRDIIRDLKDHDFEKYLALLPVAKTLVDQLSIINEHYAKLYDQRLAEREARTKGLTAELRADADEKARVSARKINAYNELFEKDHLLDAIITTANTILDEARAIINRRDGNRHRGENQDGGDTGAEFGPGPAIANEGGSGNSAETTRDNSWGME